MSPQRGAMPPKPPFLRMGRPPPQFKAPSPGVPPVRAPLSEGGRHRPTPPAARRGRSPHLIVHGWAQQRRGPRSLAPAAAAVSLPGRRGVEERISSPALSASEAALSVPPHPPPHRLGRRLLGRGPSRPRRPPHCVSLTGSASPAPAPRNRKPPQRHSGPRAPPMPARRTPRGAAPPLSP